jgi:transposase
MKRIPKQECTAEFKEQAVAIVKDGRKVTEVARELGVATQTLRNWIKASARGKLHEGRDVTPEQMELSRLRAENVRLQLENEILKKATAYFARDVL